MYSDIYSKLTTEERKILEVYHRKVHDSQSKRLNNVLNNRIVKSAVRNNSKKSSFSKDSSRRDRLKPEYIKSPLQKHSVVLKKTFSASRLSSKSPTRSIPDEKPNLRYEIERLLRAVYRHYVICPEFKQDLNDLGGISLLDEYLRYRQLNN
jgi:hypothetical protein